MKKITFYLSLLLLIFYVVSSSAQIKNKPRINKSNSKNVKNKKELVYLFTANGGMVGYFSDGTVVGCPRCDFCRSNILAMFKEKPMGTWDLKKPEDFISYEADKGWVLINYKWKEKVPQF